MGSSVIVKVLGRGSLEILGAPTGFDLVKPPAAVHAGEPQWWDVEKQKTAVKVTKGATGWSSLGQETNIRSGAMTSCCSDFVEVKETNQNYGVCWMFYQRPMITGLLLIPG